MRSTRSGRAAPILVAGLLCLGTCGCGGAIERGEATARGLWADGTPIDFVGRARLVRNDGGRVELRTTASGGRPRFLGFRFAYQASIITAPGTYEVTPDKPMALVELYLISPDPNESALRPVDQERLISSGIVRLDALPGGAGRSLQGSFEQVVLRRAGETLLTLGQGSFWAEAN